MLTADRRWNLIRCFGIPPTQHADFMALLDAIEGDVSKAGLVAQVETLLDKLAEVETALQKLGTKEAGLIKADVLEFENRDRFYFTQGRRDEILSQIACLIGWDWSIGILAF